MVHKLAYQMSIEETLQTQHTTASQGLSWDEAAKRKSSYGSNELTEGEKVAVLAIFLNQFRDFMVLVLMGATLISGLLGEYLDAITIIAIIVMNGILGFMQEFRAERSLRALKALSSPTANVLRESSIHKISAIDLVPGDIIVLESGDRIPADIRFIKANNVHIEESALTGESVAVSKHIHAIAAEHIPLGDQKNLGFMGTMVIRGTGTGIVIRTGMNTEMGEIAKLIQNAETMETPLQHRLQQLGKILILLSVVLTIVVVAVGILHGQPAYTMFLSGVSLAVAAIPEGLPAIVTIALALGVQRMIKRHAIVRKLPSVETLGCASVICSDKTGTLTQNKMTVTHLWYGGKLLNVSGNGYNPQGDILSDNKPVLIQSSDTLRRMAHGSVLCNNASLSQATLQDQWTIKGDPTEGAMLVFAAKAGVTASKLDGLFHRVQEFPFDSERKCMSVVANYPGGKIAYVKGAPDLLLERCSHIMWDEQIIPFTQTLKMKVMAANEALAHSALRVLGLAFRELNLSELSEHADQVEANLVFIGLSAMIDPPRKEVREAISKCRKAGIRTVMITGDHRATAEAIAKQLGILPANGLILEGNQLNEMNEAQLADKVEDVYVYARVSPEHKLNIVKALQSKGHIVAMTGDGVNDAPAIKSADIGISMGISGTDVAKEASSLVLSDDNFATIVAAIEEGRGIYENIRKFIRYLLASNVGEILTMFFAMILVLPLPLLPIQILWVNLVTDGLPAMALGVDQAEKDLMQHKPRGAKESIFARRLGWKIISRGFLIGICTLGAFWLTLRQQNTDQAIHLLKAQSVAFATLVVAQLIHVFDCRSSRSIFHRNPLQNRYLVFSVISSLFLLLGVLYIHALQPIFKTVDLSYKDWMLVLVAAGIPTFLMGIGSIMRSSKKPKTIQYRAKPAHR